MTEVQFVLNHPMNTHHHEDMFHPGMGLKQPDASTGKAAAALLEATSDASCTLILFTQTNTPTFKVLNVSLLFTLSTVYK